jgi:hypothetical protein
MNKFKNNYFEFIKESPWNLELWTFERRDIHWNELFHITPPAKHWQTSKYNK